MTVDLDNGNDTPKRKSKLPIILGGAIILLLIIGGVGFFAYTKVIKPKIDEVRATVIDANVESDALINVVTNSVDETINAPVYPGAVQIDPPADTATTDTRIFFQSPDTADDIIAWYGAQYAPDGFVITDAYFEGDIKVTHFESSEMSIDVFTWDLGDGLTGFSLAVSQMPTELPSESGGSMPGGNGGEEIATPMASADATPTLASPTPVPPPDATPTSASPAMTGTLNLPTGLPIELSITADVQALKAGALTRYSYNLQLQSFAITEPVAVSVEAVLPEGITLLPDDSPGIQYFPADRKISYEASFAPGTGPDNHSISLKVVTDLFIEPGELLLKGYLSIPGEDKVLVVHQLLVAK